MSDIKIEDISPAPFFARFLEGQFAKEMTCEEMRAVHGGSMVTTKAPSDQEGVPGGELPEGIDELIRSALEGVPSIPRLPNPPGDGMVTLAYPSDSDIAELADQ